MLFIMFFMLKLGFTFPVLKRSESITAFFMLQEMAKDTSSIYTWLSNNSIYILYTCFLFIIKNIDPLTLALSILKVYFYSIYLYYNTKLYIFCIYFYSFFFLFLNATCTVVDNPRLVTTLIFCCSFVDLIASTVLSLSVNVTFIQ